MLLGMTTTRGREPVPLLTMRGIVKSFPGVRALDGVDLDVAVGEVHCLLGQNGAGKSTLIKVLGGAHRPDAGTIVLDGGEVSFATPHAADGAGIATIHQELDLVPGLSVAENVVLGHEPARFGFTRPRDAEEVARALLRRLGHPEIPPRRELGRLSAAGQQVVGMARALARDARLIVMDEPSAVLDPEEVRNLFRVIRELTAEGVAVVYISHRLEEIRAIGDRVTVLKDGRTVARNLPAATTPTADVIRLMTGRSIEYVFPSRAAPRDSAVVLEVDGLSRAGEFEDVSFTVHAGEVVGLAGLVGSGRSEILETVFGARRATAGSVRVRGKALRAGSVPAAVRAGMGLCPEERKSQALLMGEPVYRNVSLPVLSRFARGGFLRRDAELDAASAVTAQLRRQPAEGRPGPLAAAGLRRPAARRADPRRRRRRAQRDLRADPAAGLSWRRGGARVQRGAGGPGAGRPGARHPGGPCRAHVRERRARRGPGPGPGDGGRRPCLSRSRRRRPPTSGSGSRPRARLSAPRRGTACSTAGPGATSGSSRCW
jgi:ribose transport system ATP-binding protein